MSSAQPDGFLAMPTTGKGSAVLVLHAWWGLNGTIKTICQRLADSGFVAFAPDLYHGKVTDQIAEAEALVKGLSKNINQAMANLASAIAFLKARAGSDDPRIAVMGFSLGANYALELSITDPKSIRSVVIFYGTGPDNFSRSKADYLGHFAEMDEFEPQSSVSHLEESLKQAGRPATFYVYRGTGHWFFEPDRVQAYNQEAASLAWERTIAFLKRSSSV